MNSQSGESKSGSVLETLGALASLAVLLFWVPLVTRLAFPQKGDELQFHLPNVHRFADHFPTLQEFRETELSMTPIMHGILGFLSRWTGLSDPAVRGWMIASGLAAVLLFALAAHGLQGGGWRRAALLLAAFPYFGATYFCVITDNPAFMFVTAAVLGQLWYIRSGRSCAFMLAAGSGLAACLFRQNLIFVTGIFMVVLTARWLLDRRGRGTDATGSAPVAAAGFGPFCAWWQLPVILLPFACVGCLIWLWGGLITPAARELPGYFDIRPATHLLAMVSISANIGYYLIPFTASVAAACRPGPRLLAAGAVLAAAGTAWCFSQRGADLVSVYGTFRHTLGFVRSFAGLPASIILLWCSILSFLIVLERGVEWVRRSGRQFAEPALLLLLLAGGIFVIGFGLFRIYERYTLPLYSFTILLLLGPAVPFKRHLVRAGWAAAVLFGLAHSLVYAVEVYEIGF